MNSAVTLEASFHSVLPRLTSNLMSIFLFLSNEFAVLVVFWRASERGERATGATASEQGQPTISIEIISEALIRKQNANWKFAGRDNPKEKASVCFIAITGLKSIQSLSVPAAFLSLLLSSVAFPYKPKHKLWRAYPITP